MKLTLRSVFALIGMVLFLMACGAEDQAAPNIESQPVPPATLGKSGQNSVTTGSAYESSGPTITPSSVSLEILTPEDESTLEVGFARVMGTTSGTTVSVDGVSTTVDGDGFFQQDIDLGPGENLIEVAASDGDGLTSSHTLRVTVVEADEGLPFSVLFPQDGFEASSASISVVGVTTPNAAVAVNGTPVDVNGVGIFFGTVDLESGGNLLEITGADLLGNDRSDDVTVFYTE